MLINFMFSQFKAAILGLCCLIFGLLLAGCGGLAGDPVIVATLPPEVAAPPTAPDIANGARLFAQHCTACHAVNGNGQGELVQNGQIPAMPSFLNAAHVGAQTPQRYYNVVTFGNLQNLMPPWNETLTEQERWDVALYAYTLAYSQELITTGEQLAPTLPEDTRPRPDEIYLQSDADLFNALKNRSGNSFSDSDLRGIVAYWRTSAFAGGALAPEATQEPLPAAITIRGTITHNTAGTTLPADMTVSLRYGNPEVGIQAQTTPLLPDNTYVFENVPVTADFAYVTIIFYQDRVFASDVLTTDELSVVTELPIAVYDITEDPFVVTIRQIDTTIQPHEVADVGTGLVFTQRVTFFNASDRVYTLSRPISEGVFPSVVWQLPPGSIVLNVDNPTRYVISDEQDIIVDTQFLLPGEHTMQVIYFVPYSEGAVIDQPLTNAIDGTLNFTLVPSTLALLDDRLQNTSLADADSNTYTGVVNIPFGTTWKYELRGSLVAPTTITPGIVTTDNLLPVVLIGLVAIVGVVVGYMVLRGRAENSNTEINALVRQIAELDALHTNGHINHDAYQQQRQALKARLAALMAGKTANTKTEENPSDSLTT